MTPRAARLTKLILGWSFLVLGVAGLFLPILQGFLFLAIGLVILAQEQPWAHRAMMGLRHRYPRMAHRFDHAHHRAEHWLHRLVHRRRPPGEGPPP